MSGKKRRTEDYEQSEEHAIASGKAALAKSPWLFNRRNDHVKGFFGELHTSPVHPDHYSVHLVDGVGTKLFFAPWSGNYRLQMQDGIAMNANDAAPFLRAHLSEFNLYFAVHAPLADDKDYYAMQVLNSYLADGMSSKLFLKIREEKGLAYAVKGWIENEKNSKRKNYF